MDFLFALGQILCICGLLYGAYLSVTYVPGEGTPSARTNLDVRRRMLWKMGGHMKRSTWVVAVVAVLGGTALLVLGHLGEDVSGTIKNDVGASVSSRGATVAVAAQLPGASRTMHASEATTAPAAGDSRLDNYRLERESCCIGNY
jgi:hypothetical protein